MIKIILILLIVLFVIIFLKYNIEHMTNTNEEPDDTPIPSEQPILSTGGKLNEAISNPEIILYYASWCYFSKEVIPEWNKFREWANKNKKDLKVTEIRCEGGNEHICNQKNIEGFPTIVLEKDDKEILFNEYPRDFENLKKFVNNN